MDAIVKVLLEKETLEREEFEALMEGATIESASQSASPAPTATDSAESVPADAQPDTEPGAQKNPRLEPGVA